MPNRRAHYVLSTHWDREWYQPFQDYRFRLVRLWDNILAGMESGELKGPFTTDGQAIILEDYLEVRPERRAQLEQLAREGRLVIGPWYVLPDEFIVSGESIVRNLRWGRQVAREFGAQPSNAGFVCDIFGHNSQMPQIFAGLGVRGAFVWRGSNQIEQRHFIWRGADGTELPTYRFGHVGYCSYCAYVRQAFDSKAPFDPEETAERAEQFLDREAQATEVEPILLFDGGDHQEWDAPAYNVLMEMSRRGQKGYDIVHTSLDAYLDDLLPQAGRISMVAEGELREPGRDPVPTDQQWLIPGVLSSRGWIKQLNAACQTILCQWAEPLSAYAHAALGREYPQGYLNVAWQWLLKNHPHDSICGCSIDQVHEDMKYRFSQCQQIGERLTFEAGMDLAANIAGNLDADTLRATVFNPLPQAVSETIELTLPIPQDWPKFNEWFGFEPKPAFRIYDASGKEVAYQRVAQAMNRQKKQILYTRFPTGYRTDDVTVSLKVALPALGYTTLTVKKGETGYPTRHPAVPGLATSERSMENELLAVTIEANGSLTVADKRTGHVYSRWLTFEDMADIGDGWYHGQAVNDQAFVSTACRADVALVTDGPMLTTFRVRIHMGAPREFRFHDMTRDDQFTDLVIDSLISLRPGVDRIEVQTTVHNTAGDHRLRVLFPSGASGAQTYLCDSPFDVVERAIPLRADNHLYRELEVETRSQQSWTAVYEGDKGAAVIASGLLESAVRDLPERPIALTLFRATRRTVLTDGEPLGQLLGPLTFRYWVAPLDGAPDRARLCRLGQQLAAGFRPAYVRAEDVAVRGAQRNLPAEDSFLNVEGGAVLSSARLVDGGLEVRLFNPAPAPIRAILTVGGGYTRAGRVNLESAPLESPALFEGAMVVDLGAKEIVTVRLS